MDKRPTFIDLGLRPDNGSQSGASSHGLPSPRITHVAGDIPPAMSPLDAFAAQSRLLAKQLDDSRRNGRRVSRLPPLAVANSLAKSRPAYFRTASTDTAGSTKSEEAKLGQEESGGNRLEVEEPTFRPESYYPRMSGVPPSSVGLVPLPSPSSLVSDQVFSTPQEQNFAVPCDYFGIARAQSPESATSLRRSMESNDQSSYSKSQSSFDSPRLGLKPERELSIESTSSRGRYPHDLRPPRIPHIHHPRSIRSVPADSSDDESRSHTPESSVSQHRKFSSGSGFSLPQSPLSPSQRVIGDPPPAALITRLTETY